MPLTPGDCLLTWPFGIWLNNQPMLKAHSTRSADTRTRILDAAFHVLGRQGYENTSIKDIAEEAGVAQGLVHYHYKSKQQLVLAVLEFVCEKVELGVEGEAGALQAFEQTKVMLRESRDTNALYVQLIGVSLHGTATLTTRDASGNVVSQTSSAYAKSWGLQDNHPTGTSNPIINDYTDLATAP